MPRVDATIDDDLNAQLEADAKEQGISRAALLRDIIQAHYSQEPAKVEAAASCDLNPVMAQIDALARYLCISRPLDVNDRMLPEEAEAAKKSWEKWKEWSKAE